MKKINPEAVLKPKTQLHSEAHVLADELSCHFREPKKFAMYLGVTKKIGIRACRRLFSEIKQSDAKEPAKLFMYKVKQYNLELKKKHGKTRAGNRKKQ